MAVIAQLLLQYVSVIGWLRVLRLLQQGVLDSARTYLIFPRCHWRIIASIVTKLFRGLVMRMCLRPHLLSIIVRTV